MMRCLLVGLGLLALLAVPAQPAAARANGYVCKILKLSNLTDEGSLKLRTNDPAIGETFAVDRSSGSIIGKWMTSEGRISKVLDAGSDQQSFMMIATPEFGFMHVLYLRVVEFTPGPIKPFLLVDDGTVITGTCE